MYITIETLDKGTISAEIINLNAIKVATDSGKLRSIEDIFEDERDYNIEDD